MASHTTGSTPRSKPCDFSVLDRKIVDCSRQHGPLATARGGRFVTFDRSLSLEAVHGATDERLTVL